MNDDGRDAAMDDKLPIAGRGIPGLRPRDAGKPTPDAEVDSGTGRDAAPDAEVDAGVDASADACVAAAERWNGTDDDCDGDIDEDFEVGAACDGPDADDCRQGTFACTADGDGVECEEAATVIAEETCDGTDNDCDGETDEGFGVGEPCDGPDSDRCLDGVVECVDAEHAACSDDAESALDVCNGADDDCDPTSGDGSEDPMIGMPCDGPDGDECREGTWTCAGGERSCSDTTGTAVDTCGGGDQDCDGAIDEGVVSDTDPPCSGATLLGSIAGDLGSETLSARGHDERWYRVRIREDNTNSLYLSAHVELASPAGADYDLFVYCASCGGTLAGSSQAGTGELDVVEVRAEDPADSDADDSFELLIEVRHWSSLACENWELTIPGNRAVDTTTCD